MQLVFWWLKIQQIRQFELDLCHEFYLYAATMLYSLDMYKNNITNHVHTKYSYNVTA